ncbi:LysR family transcriptional regulator [Allostreptomyces psammosilenae]|uniref:DNA-binding transcriptional LysR family regulator n=1 Tax=Allostreptomyces psammosilenae TaxID=1892865 RepID=A0A852ZTC7_9ACTN|nr:LysR substrate-binding domain-containing protein [Allostreptomyces psammosilenae]NYI05663.1 DNA-binding transcriptional LysR family regulator [Allostreptomyces psammosilenae]
MDEAHLRELRYFAVVAEEGHVTRAARRLFVSQPAVSKQLRALEGRLGFELFQRTPRGMALSPAGAALLPAVRDVLERWQDGLTAARAASEKRELVVGMQTAIGRGVQGPAVRLFRERMPRWSVSLRLVGWEDPSVGLADGSSDVAFGWLPMPVDGLATHLLATERRFVALPSWHPLTGRAEVPFEELLDEPFLALPEAAGPVRDFWLALDQRGVAPMVLGGVASGPDEVFEGVASGLGVVLLAEGNARLYQRPGVVCRPVAGLPPAELVLAWRAADDRAAVGAFVAAVRETAA